MDSIATRICLFSAWAGLFLAGQAAPPVPPLPNAHAHNDYEHARPLLDALDQGFCSVEADIHLVDGALLVAHDRVRVKPERTLQALYLDPLRERVQAHRGRVQPGAGRFYLLIDIKSEAQPTYEVLRSSLGPYAPILTRFGPETTVTNAVTVIISGNRPREMLAAERVRYAALDGRLPDLEGAADRHLIPWISESWATHFTWRGGRPMPPEEREKLGQIVAKAHQQGRLVRFWGGPDTATLWAAQRDAGVDLINTDKLAELRRFLLGDGTTKPEAPR